MGTRRKTFLERAAWFLTFAGKLSRREAGALLLTLAAALVFWLFVSANYRRDAAEEIGKSLVTINAYKTAQIAAWRDDHVREAVRLSRHPFLGEIVSEEMAAPGSRRGQLTAWLKDHSQQKRYASMAFLSPKGAVIAATAGYRAGTEKQFTAALAQASQKGAALLTDLYLAADGRPRMTMLSPVSPGGRGGKTLCVLAVNVDPEKEFYPLLKAAPLFFKSAETLLVRKEGDRVLYLNELDYSSGSALKLDRPISDEDLPAAAALRGRAGFFEGVDYRGVKVFSAISPVAGSNWAIITQIDREIVLAAVNIREYLSLALILPAALLFYGVFYFVVRRRERAAEAALAKNRRLMADIEQLGKVGGWEFNIDTLEQVWTEETCRIHEVGADYRPTVDKGIYFYTPASRPVIERAVQRAIERGEAFDVELEIITAKGNTRAVHAVGKADLKGRRVYGLFQDITERKQTEAALRESEMRLQFALETSGIGAWDLDLVDHTAFRSVEHDRVFGYAELLPRWTYEMFLEHVLPEDRALVDDRFQRAIAAQGNWNFECRIRRADGRVRWIWATGRHQRDAAGAARRMAGIVQDITERKQAEAALRESEAYVRTVLDNLPIGIAVNSVDPDVRFSYTNDLFPVIYRTTKEALGKPDGFWEAVYQEPGFREQMRKKVLEDCASGDPARMRWTDVPVTRRGEATTFVTGQNIPLPGGKLMISTVLDVTERKLAEGKLEEAARNWRDTFNAIDDIVWMMDAESRIIRVNKATEKTFRLPAGEIIGRHCWEVVHGTLRPIPECPSVPARKNLRRETAEYVLNGKTFEIIVDPIIGADGKYAGAVHILRDITVRKQAELEKEKLNQDLVEKKREMENFLYITTHDLRGPLVNIQGFSQNLARYLKELRRLLFAAPLPPETGRALEKLTGGSIPEALKFVLESSNKMDGLITALLKVSRMGRVEMKPETLEMNGLLKTILDSLYYHLEECGGKIKCGSLPPCKADPAAVSQIFTNLLDNAVKYRHKDRPLAVSVTGELKGELAVYAVTDNGSGIPAADLPRIWNVFFQPGKTSRAPGKKGEGIGLHMVKLMAEKSGGGISVESKDGEGTVFRVRLPAV